VPPPMITMSRIGEAFTSSLRGGCEKKGEPVESTGPALPCLPRVR
jgi:hypothetical protein